MKYQKGDVIIFTKVSKKGIPLQYKGTISEVVHRDRVVQYLVETELSNNMIVYEHQVDKVI